MLNRRMLSREEETPEDVEVTSRDQEKINLFSTLHAKQSVLKEEIEQKEQDLSYLHDLTNTLEELDLLSETTSLDSENPDSATLVPYKIGDSFFHIPLPSAQKLLAEQSEELQRGVELVKQRLDKGREEMEKLKVELYAKFGKAINLEAD